jgi:hypothetical protein
MCGQNFKQGQFLQHEFAPRNELIRTWPNPLGVSVFQPYICTRGNALRSLKNGGANLGSSPIHRCQLHPLGPKSWPLMCPTLSGWSSAIVLITLWNRTGPSHAATSSALLVNKNTRSFWILKSAQTIIHWWFFYKSLCSVLTLRLSFCSWKDKCWCHDPCRVKGCQ